MKNKTFDFYSDYYDLLYKDKNYNHEVDYLENIIKSFNIQDKTILDLGCGTGSHAAHFIERGYEIYGVEPSEKMCEIAMRKGINIYQNDIASFSINRKFKIITALFHVFSYLTENDVINSSLLNIKRHMDIEGIFIFDFWYLPAVLELKPETRIKRIENDFLKITRIAEPVVHFDKNIVDVNYEVLIEDLNSERIIKINETHKMRYFSLPEIEYYLNNNGFKVINFEAWLTKEKPSENTWGVTSICKLSDKN